MLPFEIGRGEVVEHRAAAAEMALGQGVLHLGLALQEPVHGGVELARSPLLLGALRVLGIDGLAQFPQAQHLAQAVVLGAFGQGLGQGKLAAGLDDPPSHQGQGQFPQVVAFSEQQLGEPELFDHARDGENVAVGKRGLGDGHGVSHAAALERRLEGLDLLGGQMAQSWPGCGSCTLLPSRQPSRSRIAGGEFRLGISTMNMPPT